jgi:hypothetical protein
MHRINTDINALGGIRTHDPRVRAAEDINILTKKTKLRGLSPQANYTDRATATCRRS